MGSSASTDWGSVAQWFSVGVTFMAVCVALFKEEIIRTWRRPQLRLSIRMGAPDCIKTRRYVTRVGTPRPLTEEIDIFMLRLWVENEGKARAEKVQVFAAELSLQTEAGLFETVKTFLPMNLRWTLGHETEIYIEGIAPKMGRHCDLGSVVHPGNRFVVGQDKLTDVEESSTVFALSLEIAPMTNSHLLRPGTYRLTLKVAGANATPRTHVFLIAVTGQWSENAAHMFAENIVVTAEK